MLPKLCIALLVINAAHGAISRKSLAGPPSEFGLYSIPDPSKTASTSQAALLPVNFAKTLQNGYSWEQIIDVDSESYFAFTVYCPVTTKVTLYDANRKVVDISKLGTAEMTEILGTRVPTTTYQINSPKPGVYTIHLDSTTKVDRDIKSEVEPDGYVVIMNQSPLELESYVNTFNLVVGSPIGLVAQMVSGGQRLTSERDLGSVLSAQLDVVYPDGHEEIVSMKDNGMDGDLVASDGAYIATVPATEAGYYTVQASITGVDAAGHAFMRTSEHVFSVSDIATSFSGKGVIQPANAQKMLPVQIGLTKSVARSVRIYGELFGSSGSQAICWIGGIADVQTANGVSTVTLLVDSDWFGTKSVQGPYVLKNVVMQDVESWSVVASTSSISLTSVKEEVLQSYHSGRVNVITERMRNGPRPDAFSFGRLNSSVSPIVLLHGYCSQYNPWEPSASDFTNPQFFLNPRSSLGHDAYAQKIADWSTDFGSYSVIGHSQGGIVAAHLKNYYWSGMDQVQGSGRLVQSAASPYQGNSAAGFIARIGKLFGIGCGTNVDLTVAGSTLWLAGISDETRSHVYFYSATYKTSAFFDYCNLAMNLVLKGYNDGIAESAYASLPNANNQGNAQPWCHSDGMKYPPIYLDHEVNQLMNALAQRSSSVISTISHTLTTASGAGRASGSIFGVASLCVVLLALF